MKKVYHKLIRDRIPERIAESGQSCVPETKYVRNRTYSDFGYRGYLYNPGMHRFCGMEGV